MTSQRNSQSQVTAAPFDFGLSQAQEARALRLHRGSIVVDLLSQGAGGNIFAHFPKPLLRELFDAVAQAGPGFDGLGAAENWPFEMSRLGKSDLIKDWYQQAGLTCGTYGINVHDGNNPLLNKWEQAALRYAELPWLRYVTTAREIRQAKHDGVVAFYAHCQPVYPAPRDLSAFDRAYAKGLRSFMLTYNQMDNIGVGCTERVDAGLSEFGIQVVGHCNDLGMIVDVSHCGHLTTLDACRYSKRPVNANHTCAKAIHAHARAKSDEELRAIAETGGVIGVLVVPAFITSAPVATIEHALDHIDYIANLVGWQHVAIGTDWPMQAPQHVLESTFGAITQSIGFRPEHRLDLAQQTLGFEDIRDMPNFSRGLVKRGYSDEEIVGILGENALRVFAEICG